MKKVDPAKLKSEKPVNPRDEANAKAAKEKSAARGANAKPGHRLYPHLD